MYILSRLYLQWTWYNYWNKNPAIADSGRANVAQCDISLSSAGYLSLMPCFSVLSENITINHTLPKVDPLGYILYDLLYISLELLNLQISNIMIHRFNARSTSKN